MGAVREVVSGVLTWPWLSEPHGYDFNGYLVRDPGGNVCIDPVQVDDEVLATLGREGVAVVALTNRNHVRAAAAVRARTGARVLIHPADAPYARQQGAVIDGELVPGERVGPLTVVAVPGKSPGEVAFHWPERRLLIVGDAIIGNPPGACAFLREKVMDDPPRLRASVRALLALDFDVLLVGDGTPILGGAKERVAALCESVSA
ncbi:MAG: MBL fold metallo-hydrolase [Deltaproteobacteria bacterium]|nr:MBL fold metallo-hydrolase [Deltaproteobacteria bacterium]